MPAPAVVPMALPDRGVGRQETAVLDERDERVGDPVGHRAPPLIDERGVAALREILRRRPEEQPEPVELDVGAVLIRVALFLALAEVAHDRNAVGMSDIALIRAGARAEHELETGARL